MTAGVRARLAAALIAAAALVCWPLPAQAGGPTSVLLVARGSETATALYHSQPRYEQLEKALQGGARAEVDTSLLNGDFIGATWLIHDVSVWRIDRIFMDAPGGPLIATEEYMDKPAPHQGPVVSPSAVWHKSANPAQLRGLLKALGLYKSSKAPVPGVAQADFGQIAPASASDSSAGFGTGWWWAVPGLVVGALIALVGVRVRKPREATQELLG